MIRTQIQLTPEQARALKRLSTSTGKSVAELIRISVDTMLSSEAGVSREELLRRALAAAGSVSGGPRDLAANHDQYLVEAFES